MENFDICLEFVLELRTVPEIAGFLRYSITTIYTYRSKLKNRPLAVIYFEEEVMKIEPFAG